jgi:serine/threonine protein kinase
MIADAWLTRSVGCILAELVARKPLFKGKDLLSQLRIIIEMLGTPSDEDLKDIGSEKARLHIKSFGVIPPKDFGQVFKDASPVLIDLLKKLIMFNPV